MTSESGLVLSETVPDNFDLFCAKTNPGRVNKIEIKRAGSKNLAMGFVLLMVWGLHYKVSEFIRRGVDYVMKGGRWVMTGSSNNLGLTDCGFKLYIFR